jgi:hypothetical protein
MNGVMAPWLTEIVVIGFRDWTGKGAAGTRHLPWPSELLATFVLYGILSLAPEGQWSTAAAAVGWGFVAATLLNMYSPGTKTFPGPSSQATAGMPQGGTA